MHIPLYLFYPWFSQWGSSEADIQAQWNERWHSSTGGAQYAIAFWRYLKAEEVSHSFHAIICNG